MYINKAMVYGNLTRDPEMRALPSGQQVASFSLATNRVWKDKSGAKQESVDYHNIVLFAKLAELAAQYLKKGSSVFIEGRMQTRSWDDPTSGGKKYRTEIVADTMQFGPRASGTGTGGSYTPASSAKSSVPAHEPLETIEYPQEDINPDDIPF
ncbi:MAG TPA: single-stranded DNA-binding protein [Candidatus Yonathbacteria bacterium]|nr:single-stranded DNA-binding protein [Candidatus Yonathbacteria bacterium]